MIHISRAVLNRNLDRFIRFIVCENEIRLLQHVWVAAVLRKGTGCNRSAVLANVAQRVVKRAAGIVNGQGAAVVCILAEPEVQLYAIINISAIAFLLGNGVFRLVRSGITASDE